MQSVTDFLSFIQSRITLATLIYICIIVLVIILLVILSNHLRRRKANARFEELEKDVNAVRNNSLDYKFNKAKAFAKVNADIMERVNELTPKYNVCIEGMDECDTLCEKAHDALEGHHTKRAMRRMDELETSLKDARERIRIVTKALDNILQKETEVRDFANALKERYQNVRQVYTTNRNSFYKATTYFDSRFQEIENDFSNFEEWMYACEFNKAKDEGNKIAASIDSLSSEIALCPDLYERTKSIIPAAMMEINQNATELSQSDINLGYLEINKNLNEAASQLKEAEHRIDVGNLKEAQMMISQIGDGVLKLQDAISQEKAAYDEIHGGLEQNLITVSEIQVELNDIKKMYSNIRDRFGLEDWTHRFALADEQMGNVQEASTLLQREIKADQTPLIEVVRYYREFVADINEFKTQIDEMKSKLISASSDESRAQKQLIKLQLILNDVCKLYCRIHHWMCQL